MEEKQKLEWKEKTGLKEESSSLLFRRIVGFIFVLYGFFAFVDPEKYSFGNISQDFSQFIGLVLLAIGLFLILRREDLF